MGLQEIRTFNNTDCNDNVFLHSTPYWVAPGDVIWGLLGANSCDPSSGICNLDIYAVDLSRYVVSHFNFTPNRPMTRAFGADLEYPRTFPGCSYFPNSASTAFSGVSVYVPTSPSDPSGAQVVQRPLWYGNFSNPSPLPCKFGYGNGGGGGTAYTLTLYY